MDGTKIRFLTIVDEHTRECLALRVGYTLQSAHALDTLVDLFLEKGLPDYIRSDNGSEFTAKLLTNWLEKLNVKTATTKVLMASLEMSFLTAKLFTP